MPALSAYTNVENTALVILRQKGFQVWCDKDRDRYCAEKSGWDFVAHGMVELLGLIAIYEHRQPQTFSEYWWKIDEPDLIQTLPSKPDTYRPVWEKKRDSASG